MRLLPSPFDETGIGRTDMAMEERQTQIREGAGLEESRLNVEFIEWLRKWSTPAIVVLALIAAGFFLYRRVEQSRVAHESRAYVELSQVISARNPSPEALKNIAADYDNVGAVGSLARLRAADVYLRAVRLGLRVAVNTDPGPDSDLNEDGTPKNLEDVLTEDDRRRYLAEAEALYRHVYEHASKGQDRTLLRIDAAFGLAAVAESRGEFDLARRLYTEIQDLAKARGLTLHANLAATRLDTLDALASPMRLYARADLPPDPEPPAFELPEPIRLTPPEELDPGSIIGPPPGEPAGEPPPP